VAYAQVIAEFSEKQQNTLIVYLGTNYGTAEMGCSILLCLRHCPQFSEVRKVIGALEEVG
jgi:hypothetical protein